MSTLSWLRCLGWMFVCFTGALSAAEPDPPPLIHRSLELRPLAADSPTSAPQAFELFSEPADGENRFFISGAEAFESMRQMRARLADPQQREVLRAEQRTALQRQHQDLGEALDIDAATQEKLFDLLTDKQISSLDEFHSEHSRNTLEAHNNFMQARADAETEHLAQVRAVLGEEGFERWQDYTNTLAERFQVGRLDAQLDSASKLRPEQKNSLIALLREHAEREIEQNRRSRSSFRIALDSAPSREDMQQTMLKQVIAEHEARLRLRPESDRRLAEQAAQFLTPAQLAAFSQMNAEQTDNMRLSVERMRVRAGLSAEIPEQPEVAPAPQRVPFAGNVKVDLRLAVNRNTAVTVSHTGRNGELIEFEVGDGLWAQATATLFEDQWYDVHVTFFEQGRNGKRRLPGTSGFGAQSAPLESGLPGSAGSSTMITGSKGYYVSMSANAVGL